MEIILDEIRKDAILINKDHKEISRYSFKNLVNKEYSINEFKADIEEFNKTLRQQEEFGDIKGLADCIKIYKW